MINIETLKEDIVRIALTEPKLLDKHIDFFNPDYYKGDFKIYVEVIRQMYFEADDINDLTFLAVLRKKNSELASKAFKMLMGKIENLYSSFPQLLVMQVQAWASEEAVKVGHQLAKSMYEVGSDSFQVITEAKAKLEALIDFKAVEPTRSVHQAGKDLLSNLKKGKRNGITTGLPTLDKIIGGWIGGKLIIIAGRPGMGKSVLATFFAYQAAIRSKRVLFFSLEMSEEELTGRLFSLHLRSKKNISVQYSHIDKYTLLENEIKSMEDVLPDFNSIEVMLDDNPSMDIDSIVSKTIVENSKNKIDMVVVDYMGLVPNNRTFSRKDLEVADVSRKLKMLAKTIDAPLLALSQLSRKVEDRPDKKPVPSDLRDSGSLEQDADIIMFPFRPEYYGFTQDMSGASLTNKIQIGIAKQRGGVVVNLQESHVPTFDIDLATNYIFESTGNTFEQPETLQKHEKQSPF